MTSQGDDYPGLGEQGGAEARRIRDVFSGKRGGGSGPWNRTPGGCGSKTLGIVLVMCATVFLLLYLS